MRNRILPAVLGMSCRVYSFLLPLYPLSLRCQFGSDMADVFEKQIRDECEQNGFTGLVRVWFCVAWEVIRGAGPTELGWETVGAPLVSFLSSLVLFVVFFWASGIANHCTK